MLKQSKGWIARAVLIVVTTLPVCVLAQDTTVRDTESDDRQRKSRNNGRVLRDSDGIPHIAARTEREVIYLQGFTHAQDRLFQMDVTRRQAEGTLAELLGAGALASDVQLRTAFADAFNGSTDQSDYRWGRLHRVVLAHPLGAPFSIPPAGGAFPQPLPNLPGISIDGGLHTVDVGTHPINLDSSNGFMFRSAPSLRYVASLETDGIKSVSSLPGGQSGVPSSQFYLNLLGRWLTNETFPLRTHVVD